MAQGDGTPRPELIFLHSANGGGCNAGGCARAAPNCSSSMTRRYRRTVAVCSIDGVDLADWLVRSGLALDWPTYSKGKYDAAQRDAEHAGRGIWEGTYVEPWLFRACIRQGGRPGDCSDDANSHP
jgi:hypothetical protein